MPGTRGGVLRCSTRLKNSMENKMEGGTKKRKAETSVVSFKRAAFCDITNNALTDKNNGKVTLKSQVKKGLTHIRSSFKKSSKISSSIEIEETSLDERIKNESENEDEEAYVSAQETMTDSSFSSLPEGVYNFDLENENDPNQCSVYVKEIFEYYKLRESKFIVKNYMTSSRQPQVTEVMRAILVDWLVEVQESFELNHETLYTAVKIVDLYLSLEETPVLKEDLQLIGATACLIACKIDERIPPLLDDFVYVCDDAYSREQIISSERKMIRTIDFDVGYPLSYRFLRRYGRVCKVSMALLTLARYILELSLLEYELNIEGTSESKLAASALVLAFKIKGCSGWESTLAHYSRYSIYKDLKDLVYRLFAMMKKTPVSSNLDTIKQKYSHVVFYEVARLELPNFISIP